MSEKTLALEAVVSTGCTIAKFVTKGVAPPPSAFVADIAVYTILSGVSAAVPKLQGLCAGLGGLMVLGQFVAPYGPGRYLIDLIGSGKLAAGPTDPTTLSASVTSSTGSSAAIGAILSGAGVSGAGGGTPPTSGTGGTKPGTTPGSGDPRGGESPAPGTTPGASAPPTPYVYPGAI